MKPLVAGFGEIMLRLSPEGFLRLNQSLPGSLRATFGGGEANVCVSLARFPLTTTCWASMARGANIMVKSNSRFIFVLVFVQR